MKNFTISFLTSVLAFILAAAGFAQSNRTYDGYNNNLIHKEWGAVGANQLHPGAYGFNDAISEPGGQDRPNPRYISNSLFTQNTLANDPRSLSAYCWAWGQFIDHDITLVNDNHAEEMMIPVPTGDAFFDPNATGNVAIPLLRSESDPATGTGVDNPRQFPNEISAFIDASAVYGSDQDVADWLRTFSGGKLKTSEGNLLPWNTTTGEFDDPVGPNAPEMAMPFPFVQKWFVAGDIRVNENPVLTAMHTLFVREHNRLCDELKVNHPNWSDEQLFQHARRLVGGQMQAIVYEEWLPVMGIELPPYNGYDLFANPGILNVFSAAAYRYGHTTINSIIVRMDNNGDDIPQGDILLRDAFFNPNAITSVDGIEPYLVGTATVVQQDFDCKLVDDLRNFLFGAPGAGGLDLAAVNIARGRERGLPDYNTIREEFGLERITSFSEMSADPLMNQTLEFVYGDVNKIDPWVGMLAENHMPDALFGSTAMTIIEKQFKSLRDGDRFYYENDPYISADEKQWIKATTLADIVRRNSSAIIVQDEIFKAQSLTTTTNEISDNNEIDIAVYPNPVRNMLFLRIPAYSRQSATIQMADLQGRIVLEREALLSDGNNTLTLTLPHGCSPGLYIVTVQADGRIGQRQVVKQ